MRGLSRPRPRTKRLPAALASPADPDTGLAGARGLHVHPRAPMLLAGVQARWYAGAAPPPWRVSR